MSTEHETKNVVFTEPFCLFTVARPHGFFDSYSFFVLDDGNILYMNRWWPDVSVPGEERSCYWFVEFAKIPESIKHIIYTLRQHSDNGVPFTTENAVSLVGICQAFGSIITSYAVGKLDIEKRHAAYGILS